MTSKSDLSPFRHIQCFGVCISIPALPQFPRSVQHLSLIGNTICLPQAAQHCQPASSHTQLICFSSHLFPLLQAQWSLQGTSLEGTWSFPVLGSASPHPRVQAWTVQPWGGIKMCDIPSSMQCLEKGLEWSLVSSLLGRGVWDLGSVRRWCTECPGVLQGAVPALPGEGGVGKGCQTLSLAGCCAWHSAVNCWEPSEHCCKCKWKLFFRCSALVHGITFPEWFLVGFFSP